MKFNIKRREDVLETLISLAKNRDSETPSYKKRDCETHKTAEKRDCETREIRLKFCETQGFLRTIRHALFFLSDYPLQHLHCLVLISVNKKYTFLGVTCFNKLCKHLPSKQTGEDLCGKILAPAYILFMLIDHVRITLSQCFYWLGV